MTMFKSSSIHFMIIYKVLASYTYILITINAKEDAKREHLSLSQILTTNLRCQLYRAFFDLVLCQTSMIGLFLNINSKLSFLFPVFVAIAINLFSLVSLKML